MTDQITVPRETWDAMREALESVGKAIPAGQSTVKTCYAINNMHRDAVQAALTAANAVSAEKPKPPEGVTVEDCTFLETVGSISITVTDASHPQATEPTERRKLYECTGCGHLYEDRPSSCDCGENPANTYFDWVATPSAPEAKQ